LVAFLGINVCDSGADHRHQGVRELNSFIVVVKVTVLLISLALEDITLINASGAAEGELAPVVPPNLEVLAVWMVGRVPGRSRDFSSRISASMRCRPQRRNRRTRRRTCPMGILGSLAICTLL